MVADLPDDILQLVCDQLLARRDFATLYNCAVSCKRLAPCALSDVYRIYNETTDDDEEAEGFQTAAQFELTVHRLAVKWRTITMSALDKTMLPYYRYLRMLDLRDLGNLVGDERFRGKVEKTFFADAMSAFRRDKQIRLNAKRPARTVVDQAGVIEAIGDAVIPKTDTLEILSGQFGASALERWIPHLPRLQRLELYVGRALMGDAVQKALYSHCSHFNALSVFYWFDPATLGQGDRDTSEPDTQLGQFFTGLPSGSLGYFETFGNCGAGEKTFAGLAKHARSLKELRLCVDREALQHLRLLRDCTNLESFKLEMSGAYIDENAIKQEDMSEITAWLKDCHNLRTVEFSDAVFAPTLLTPVLQSSEIRLRELKVLAKRQWYVVKEHRQFHQSIANQRQLELLNLEGDGEGAGYDDNQALVESVCQCQHVKHLKMRGVSETLSDAAITTILSSLSMLEDLYVEGLMLGDTMLDPLAEHPRLQTVYFMGITNFTFEGLLGFAQKLDASKEGFELSIPMAAEEGLLGDQEVQVIRQSLYDKVHGKLEYQASRDPNADDFSVESD